MSGEFDARLYPLPVTHVAPGDSDRASLAQDNIAQMLAEALRVRDQHRHQIEALAIAASDLRAERNALMAEALSTAETSCVLKQAFRKRMERHAADLPVDVLDSAIAKMRAQLAREGVADPTLPLLPSEVPT